ncbi:Gfo/Idh/MocA family oxidoreductase [bacterium]|nr:Gfo/Idh/MocA family oxidoreductase [bacterium]
MKPFQALLVGLGQIGCGYDAHLPFQWNQPESSPRILSHARALACHPDFELLSGIDPSPTARVRFFDLYRRPAFADLQSWIASSPEVEPDIVIIAVAPQLQPSLVAQLLSVVSPRLLLLEKPVAISLNDAYALEKLCNQKQGLAVAVNYIRRYLPAVQHWQKRLQSCELGELLHGSITYGKGILSNGSHFVNIAEAWVGPLKLERIYDAGTICLGFDREASVDFNVLNHGSASLHMRSVGDSGLRAGEVDLWFRGGRLCWPNNGRSIHFFRRMEPVDGDAYASLACEPKFTFTNIELYQFTVIDSLAKFLMDSSSYPLNCSLRDGINTLETLSKCL